jgi:hypothetical protein
MENTSPPPSRSSALQWYPGAIRDEVMTAASTLGGSGTPCPSHEFFAELADYAERQANDDIAIAIEADKDVDAIAALERVRNRFYWHRHGIIFAAERAADITLTKLALYLLLGGSDGYNALDYPVTWGGPGTDPEWGTIWAIHQPCRDFTPAFIFKVCLKGDSRFLAVECHAPTRHLPDGPADKLRARTIMTSGVPVVTFSPTEVEASPSDCAEEIGLALSVLAEELLALHGMATPPHHDFRPRP